MDKNRIHLLNFTAEPWPTYRPDVVALFGKFLPRYGVTCDLVSERAHVTADDHHVPWGGGQAMLCKVPANRTGQYLVKCWHNLRVLISIDAKQYDAIQVRDMTVTALVGLMVARMKGLRFFYWLSYPQSEGQIDRARMRGFKGGMRFWFPLAQGTFGKWLLYRIVLPRVDHVFVQSRQMQLELARKGIPMACMTPVPMGVDTEAANQDSVQPVIHPLIKGKRVIAYLGTLDPIRQIEVLFHMLAIARQVMPDIFLVLAGDTEDASHRQWLKQEAERLGVADLVLWTGWLPAPEAWSYMRAAEIGLSPIPRGYLMDMGSPTKAIEYMALGLPVVANDNPDQQQVIEESGAGTCVSLGGASFAEAVIDLLNAPETMRRMSANGREYVERKRNYDNIARMVAQVYFDPGKINVAMKAVI